MRGENPFDSPQAHGTSSFAMLDAGRLVRFPGRGVTTAVQSFVHESLRAVLLSSSYPCLGAQAAIRSGHYAMGFYEELGAAAVNEGLARDLFQFSLEQDAWEPQLSSFLACFASPVALDEPAFEQALWRQLQTLHELDRPHHAWDPAVSDDPANPHFSFSFAGRAYFVVGLHAANSRWSRRFAWPTLVFNAHRQFERLRVRRRLASMQKRVRRRDEALQGSPNPTLSDFGLTSEARQYSGRAVEPSWGCPFRPQSNGIEKTA